MGIVSKIKAAVGLDDSSRRSHSPERDPSASFIDKVIRSTRNGLRSLIGSLIERGMNWLGLSKKASSVNDLPLPSDSREKIQAVLANPEYEGPEKNKLSSIKQMETKVKTILDSYRERMVSSGKVKLKHSKLKTTPELMNLAESVAEQQAVEAPQRGGKLRHNLESVQKYGYHEILTSGFNTAEEAIEKYINSVEHYPTLVGDFSEVGYSIKEGSDGKFYLAILFKKGKPASEPLEKMSIANDSRNEHKYPLKEPLVESLRANKSNIMANYFQALDRELSDIKKWNEEKGLLKAAKDEISYELNKKGIAKLEPAERRAGKFVINLRSKNKVVTYLVIDNAPKLFRTEVKDGVKKEVLVKFEGLLEDFKSAQDSSEVTKKLQSMKKSEKVKQEDKVTPSQENLEEAFNLPAKEPNPRKDKEGELVDASKSSDASH